MSCSRCSPHAYPRAARSALAVVRAAALVAIALGACGNVTVVEAPDAAPEADAAPDGALDPCHDGARDGDETDVDCGDPSCAQCAYGRRCHDDNDCEAGACMIVAGPLPVCAPLCHYAPCAGCCCVTHGVVQPEDYACTPPALCLAAGGACL